MQIIQQNNLYGIANAAGEEIIPPIYKQIFPICEHKTVAMEYLQGHLLVNYSPHERHFYEKIEPYKEGVFKMYQEEKFGFMDKQGHLLVPCTHTDESLFEPADANLSYTKKDISEILRQTQQSYQAINYYLFWQLDLSSALPQRNYLGAHFYEATISQKQVFILKLKSIQTLKVFYVIIKNGLWQIPPINAGVYEEVVDWHNGFLFVKAFSLRGLLDYDLEWVVPCKYAYIYAFEGEYAKVKTVAGLYNYIDKKGKELLPNAYPFAAYYPKLQVVEVHDEQKKSGVFDLNGRLLLPFVYDLIYDTNYCLILRQNSDYFVYYPRTETLQRFKLPEISQKISIYSLYDVFVVEMKATAEKPALFGLLNQTGDLILPIAYEEIKAFRKGLWRVRKSGKWGLVNREGRFVLSCLFDKIETCGLFFIRARLGEYWGLYTPTANQIFACQYEQISLLMGTKDQIRTLRKGQIQTHFINPIQPIQK